MNKRTTIPEQDGLYWYFENGKDAPEPVLIIEFINKADNLEEFNARKELIESTGIIVNSPKNLDRHY